MTNKDKNVAQIICEQAMRENTDLKRCGQKLNGQYIGNTREAKIVANMSTEAFFRKHVIHLYDEPVSFDTFVNFNPDVRSTGGYYTLCYCPW